MYIFLVLLIRKMMFFYALRMFVFMKCNFLGIFDCVDDTKFVGKAVISELTENMEEMMTNKYCVR